MLEQFKNDGFVILRNIVESNLREEAIAISEEVIDYFKNEDVIDPFRQYFLNHRPSNGVLYDLYFRHPEFHKIVHHKEIIKILTKLIGQNLFLYENSLVYKPKNKKNEVPWHQDFMNRPNEPPKFIVWVALNDVTKENGAMKLLKGSHKDGFRSFIYSKGKTHNTVLNLDGINIDNYIYAEMAAGDILIFNQLLIHGSDRISSEMPRLAYRFAVQGFEELYTPRCVPVVLSGGRPSSYIQAKSREDSLSASQKILNRICRRWLISR